MRDKETGKSKGFCFLRYEDQRSCDLAVDNLGGATIMGKMLSVDHTRYKPKDDEEIYDNTRGVPEAEAAGDNEPASESDDERPMLKEERELQQLKLTHDDDDPMKAYLIEQKQEEVKAALQRFENEKSKPKSDRHHHRHRHHKKDDEPREHRHRHRRHRSRSRSPRDDAERERRQRRSRRPSTSPADEERRRHHRDRGQRRDHSASAPRDSKDRSND